MDMDTKFVLFDFDGVIADSFSLASALAMRKCKHNTVSEYRTAFEGNIYDTHENLSGDAARNHDGCEHVLDWWPEYEKGFRDTSVFEGIVPAVRTLAESYTLIIVTSCVASIISPFLERHGIAGAFLDILDVDVHTQKTKKIEMIFEKYGAIAADCVFVTDTLGDIREAAHHSMGAIACSWGFHPRETLQKGAPFRIVSEPAEIIDAVNEYFAR